MYRKYEILKKEIIKMTDYKHTFEYFLPLYEEGHRFYHTIEHIYLNQIELYNLYKNKKLTKENYDMLSLINLFHDLIYISSSKTNEQDSAEKAKDNLKYLVSKEVLDIIYNTILETNINITSESNYAKIFNDIDRNILKSNNLIELIDWENKIRKEYSYVSDDKYKEKRIKFLEKHLENKELLRSLIEYINN